MTTVSQGRSLYFAVVVPDRLDVVAIGIECESGVVAWPVVAITRPTVVFRSGREGGLVEGVDLLATAGFENQMQGRVLFVPGVTVSPLRRDKGFGRQLSRLVVRSAPPSGRAANAYAAVVIPGMASVSA
jgi:hypothetical protein